MKYYEDHAEAERGYACKTREGAMWRGGATWNEAFMVDKTSVRYLVQSIHCTKTSISCRLLDLSVFFARIKQINWT